MQLVDEVQIDAKAGDGGDGLVAWRREKFIPMGGPAGGDGGDGGNVILCADESVHSLLDFRYMPRLFAKNGEKGRSKNQYGAKGTDVIAKVPVGTQVFDVSDNTLIADLTKHGMQAVVCKGGSGGFGNTRFATATLQAPDFAKPGLPGESKRLRLSLKLMADVGLLGFPNAGKSTLLSALSAAKPKIGDYPFTTLNPQLGVAQTTDGYNFVIADIPGLIEGASAGLGLGFRFLKHLERVRVLCHLIEPFPSYFVDAEGTPQENLSTNILVERYEAIRQELARFNPELCLLPELVVLTKADLISSEPQPHIQALLDHLAHLNVPILVLSAATQSGTALLVHRLWQMVGQ